MKREHVALFLIAAGLVVLTSCSGLPRQTTGGGGNSSLSVTMTDTPPAGVTILSFKFTLTGFTVTPSTGTPVALISGSNPATVELTQLQADAAPLGTFTIPSNTYKSMNVTVANADISFANQSGAAIGQCPNATVCEIQPAGIGNLTVSTAPFPITVSSGGNIGVSLDFNLANAITSTVGVDFTQPNVLTAASLPISNQPTGQFEPIPDVVGVVQTVNATAQTFSLQSTRGTFAVSASSNTVFDNFLSCAAGNFTCLQNNMVVSADLTLNSNGTFTATEIEFEDTAPDDEITGVVFSIDATTQTNFTIVVLDKLESASGSLIGAVSVGNLATVQLASSPSFVVDTKGLVVPQSPLSLFQGSSNTSQMLGGQVVQVRVKTFTAASPPANASLTTDRVRLRFSVLSAPVSLAGNPNFNLGPLSPLLANQSLLSLQVQTQLKTAFEGVTDVSGLAGGDNVSVRGLFFNGTPAIVVAAKVRKH